jgi:hypothetical protein
VRRPILLSTLALGAVATGLGATGTWADFDDSARSEEIAIDSFEFAENTDIVIANQLPGGACPTDLGVYREGNEFFNPIALEYNADGTSDGTSYQEALSTDLCVRNIGVRAVTLTLVTDVLEDVDPFCTGEEATVPGETCGVSFDDPDPKPGELDDAYTLTASGFDLDGDGTPECSFEDGATIADLRDGLGTSLFLTRSGDCAPGDMIRPDETAAFHLSLAYDPAFGGRDAIGIARLSQSDRVTFQYVIGATEL